MGVTSAVFTLTLSLVLVNAVPVTPLNDTSINIYPTYWPPSAWETLEKIADPPSASLPPRNRGRRGQSATLIPKTLISSYRPHTQLAATAYCDMKLVKSWKCGELCDELSGMMVYFTGGNRRDIPEYYVGYLPSMEAAVVVHQGTTPTEFKSVFVDLDMRLMPLSQRWFPGVGDESRVHSGFARSHDGSAADVYSALEKIILDHPELRKVLCIGHSLGGALAVLDAVSLQLTLPGFIPVELITYGQPRVGNVAFADYVDEALPNAVRITHGKDPIPIIPGKLFGYYHFSGEKHIDDKGDWYDCEGRENGSAYKCSSGSIWNVLLGSPIDHTGPYDGIWMGCGEPETRIFESMTEIMDL